MGAIACNPFEVVKTRMQAATSSSTTAVGHQHQYEGLVQAIRHMTKHEGIKSLWKGSDLSAMRSFLGTGANLASYSWLRETVIEKKLMRGNNRSGLFSCLERFEICFCLAEVLIDCAAFQTIINVFSF